MISDGKLSLFTSENHTIQEVFGQMGNINQYCFYGRCLGFQVYRLAIYDMFVLESSLSHYYMLFPVLRQFETCFENNHVWYGIL